MKRVIEANAPRGENGKLRCVLCGVTMPSPQVAQTHFNGKKHQKKLAALKAASQTQEEILNDPVCDITSPGTSLFSLMLLIVVEKLGTEKEFLSLDIPTLNVILSRV